jgi:hypothetical protein
MLVVVLLAVVLLLAVRVRACTLEDMPVYVRVPPLGQKEKRALETEVVPLMAREKEKAIRVASAGYMKASDASKYLGDYMASLRSPSFLAQIERAAGRPVFLSPFEEAMFLKSYADGGDSMGWHYDANFTKGRRYTVVIPLLEDPCNTSKLEIIDCANREPMPLHIPPGHGVLYAGDRIRHRVTEQAQGCKRVSLVMILYDDERQSWWNRACSKGRDALRRFVNF